MRLKKMADGFDFDVTVVGAGMFGSSAAKHLVQGYPSLRVALIGPREVQDRTSRDIHGAHYDEGRITRSTDRDPDWAILANRSAHRFQDIERQSGVPFYHEVGYLFVSLKNGHSIERFMQNSSLLQRDMPERLDCSALKIKFPYLHFSGAYEGIYVKNDSGYVSPRNMVMAQQKISQQSGCDVIHDIVKRVTPLSQSGYRIETDRGRYLSSRKVLIATGAFTNHRQLLPQRQKPKLQYNCETVLLIKISESTAAHMSNMPAITVMDIEDGKENGFLAAYVLPPIRYPDGKLYLKLGHGNQINRKLATPEEIQDWFVHGQDSVVENYLMTMARSYFPDLKITNYHFDRCVTCSTPTGNPYIDLLTPSFGVALGGCGRGAKAADEIGNIAASMIANGRWSHDLSPDHFRFLAVEMSAKL